MPEPPAAAHTDHAIRAYRAMHAYFRVPQRDLYRESVPDSTSGKPFAYVWPFEEATKATLYMAGLPGVSAEYRAAVTACGRGRERYWDRHGSYCVSRRASYASYVLPPLGEGGDTFYDDNSWCALDLVQQYRMFGHDAALARAVTVFDFVAAGWSSDRRPHPGGLFWVDARWNRDRGTATNTGAATLALHLHELVRPSTMEYVDHAHRLYEWTRATLLATSGPMAQLYHDKVLGDGGIDTTQWIYNQGTAVAAGVMLHRLTGEVRYLAEARATADAALAYYGADGFASQPLIFTAIFFRNLLQLYAVTGTPAYLDAMQAFADRLWHDRTVHDGATDLFRPDRSSTSHTLLDQAAAVQLYALLAWPPEQYPWLA